MAAYPPASVAYPPRLSTRVELHVSCKGLKKADLLSKSDPLVAVYTLNPGRTWQEFSRTELIKNDQNPKFTKAIQMEYRFEEAQKLKFTVYDLDNETASLDDDDFLGTLECSLGEIVSARMYTKELKGKHSGTEHGTITINAEELSKNQQLLEMKFSAVGLDKKDLLGKSDPFLEFERENPDGSFTAVHKTMVIKNTLKPSWPPFSINTQVLCNSEPHRKIKVKCYDWDSDTDNDLIGEFYTTLADLTAAASESGQLEWEAINPSKRVKKKNYKNSGTVRLEFIKVSPVYTFLDYVMSGCQINFTVGVDFTGSNGNPTNPSSLHYIDPDSAKPNQYMQALMAVGSICQDYDTDKLFPALGFGAKVGDEVSHEFALNGNPHNPYCFGIGGVIEAYQYALRNVQLYGPTNAAPIIKHVAKFAYDAAKNQDIQQYFILLMLTDGELTDMNDTKLALIRASRWPMSVIIVGVGNADFSGMRELDCDEGKLRLGPEVAARDIVQFVPFRDFLHSSAEALASAVLGEVPKQLTEYMTSKGMKPLGK